MVDKDKNNWEKMDIYFGYLSPLILFLIIIYLYNAFVTQILTLSTETLIGNTILVYFVAEIMVKYIMSKNYKYFFKNYWLKILLVIPFFKGLKLVKALKFTIPIVKSSKIFKIVPKIQKLIKIPKMLRKINKTKNKKQKSEKVD